MSQPTEGQDRLDYRETEDVTEVHASVLREHSEPHAGKMPIPTWLGVISAVALCWAGIYVGVFHGGFSGSIYNEDESTPSNLFGGKKLGGKDDAAAEVPLMTLGQKAFGACMACHMADGNGTPGQIPPLNGSEWVIGSEFSEKRLISILLKGVNGPIKVKGQTYNNPNMLGLGAQMKPRELAGLLTYIRNSWGNKGSEITEAMVVAVKKDNAIAAQNGQFSVEQIQAIPVTDKIEGAPAAPAGAPTAAAAPAAGTPPAPGAPAPAPGTPPTATPAPPAPATGTPPAGNFDLAGSIAQGKNVYAVTCGTCHQPTGLGLFPAFPPLAGQEYVTGDPRRLVAITLKGVMGPITVDGKAYVSIMPPATGTFPQLKDDKNLSDVLNYVRNSFGNKADPITPEFVGKVRAEIGADVTPFTEATLKSFK